MLQSICTIQSTTSGTMLTHIQYPSSNVHQNSKGCGQANRSFATFPLKPLPLPVFLSSLHRTGHSTAHPGKIRQRLGKPERIWGAPATGANLNLTPSSFASIVRDGDTEDRRPCYGPYGSWGTLPPPDISTHAQAAPDRGSAACLSFHPQTPPSSSFCCRGSAKRKVGKRGGAKTGGLRPGW